MIKDYKQMAYDIIKPLALRNPPIKIYRNVIDEDYDSLPDDYIVYQAGISDTPKLYGDGRVILRRVNCDITVNERGTGNNENAGYLVKLVEELLQLNKIPYVKNELGYIESVDSMQTSFDFYLI